jgi:hypothetical protein
MASEGLHEDRDRLSVETQDRHRAIVSLMEELEAVDWYQQRVDGADDADLKAILAHNRDEEIEHASMILEWLRRRVPKFDEELGTYLNKEGSIVAAEAAATGEGGADEAPAAAGDGSLGIGSLKA